MKESDPPLSSSLESESAALRPTCHTTHAYTADHTTRHPGVFSMMDMIHTRIFWVSVRECVCVCAREQPSNHMFHDAGHGPLLVLSQECGRQARSRRS
jgi:hypothetical protein